MGVKLYAERRYSMDEKQHVTDDDLKRCNTEKGIKAVGFQMDPSSEGCRISELLDTRRSSSKIRNTIISTYGTFVIRKGPSNWNDHMTFLMKNKKLVPRVLKRDLVLILR